MLHELESILKQVKDIEQKLKTQAFERNEIQKTLDSIQDHSKSLHDLYQKLSELQQTPAHETAKILKIVINLHTNLFYFIDNIELVQDLLRKLRTQLTKEKSCLIT